MAGVVGREHELSTIGEFLGAGRERYVGLVLEGDPGIGKTTLWWEAIRTAEASGYRVLRSRPAEAEARLAFASLADLLAPVEEDVFFCLPDPQREAVEVALLRRRSGSRVSDARAVGAGVVSLLTFLAKEPLLLAIDDAQWLDRSSATALSFALRRLASDSLVAVLVAARVEPRRESASPLLDDTAARVARVRLTPLGLSALYHVIRNELDLVLPRPTLQRIERASGGNPLFAVELARALDEAGGRPGPGEPLPVPDNLSALLRRRIDKLPRPVRETLLLVALASSATTQLLERVLGASAELSLEHALREGVVEVRRDDIRFVHPLLASAVSAAALPTKRRELHRRLADALASEEERARHLALGSEAPSEEVAASLEDAAHRAAERGAPAEAAELLELACSFTPAEGADALARRALERIRAVGRSGDADEVIRLLDALLATNTVGPVRAGALELRAHLHWVTGTTADAERCCEEALHHVDDDERLRARVLVTLARVTLDSERMHERAHAAIDVLERMDEPDPSLLSEALAALAGAEHGLGRGIPSRLIERGLELERAAASPNVADRMSAALGAWLKYAGDFDGARLWLEATYRAAVDEGDEGSIPYALGHLSTLELWIGDWPAAERSALEHLELAERTGQTLERLTAIYNLTLVHAHTGRIEEARARLRPALEEAEGGEPWNVYLLLSVLGFVELSVDRSHEAVNALARAFDIYEETGHGDAPGVFENYAEALVGTTDLAHARDVVDLYEQRARAARKAMAIAPALRTRALLAEAAGDLGAAVEALDEALVHHENVTMPFSHARTLVVVGRVRRRIGERRAAKRALEDALAMFDELGAPLWSERARVELGRVPIRRSASTDALTATEERVAALVAEGRTNKEVAQALFISEKTVEANLTRIYRKVGVRSRAALAAQLASNQGSEPAIP